MGEKNYQVVIHTEHCADGPAVIARRLAVLSGRPESELLESLLLGLLTFRKALDYEEAAACKEMLGREGISAQIVRSVGAIRESASVKSVRGAEEADVPFGRFSALNVESADETSSKARRTVASDAAGEASGGWEALFPELAENEAAVEANVVEKKTKVLPKISAWEPELDTTEGLVERVSGGVASEKNSSGRSSSVGGRTADDITQSAHESLDRMENLKKSRAFAGEVLSGAIAQQEEARGPYAPVGFDPRPAHVPVISAILSGLAPGAGQVYNGQDALALKYSLQFWWIRPWIESVRQAREYGERIRDYQVPRPEQETLGRALRYAAVLYVCVIALVVAAGFAIGEVSERVARPQAVVVAAESVDVVGRAVTGVRFARVAANAAVHEFLDEQNKVKQEFTMSAEERAHRLYVIGHSYCAAHQYTLCETTMRRVTSLGAGNRDAYRLQAWASMQIKQGTREPMPEVGEVPTLFELELDQQAAFHDPDRDLVQPALDSMLAETAENKAKEEDKTGDAGE